METPLAYVVEDHPSISQIWQTMLQGVGFSTNYAYDGLIASEFLHAHTPSLVLLDTELPSINAEQIIRQMENDPRFVHTTLILIAPPRVAVIDSPKIDFVLRKPIAFSQLKSICKRLLPRQETAVSLTMA